MLAGKAFVLLVYTQGVKDISTERQAELGMRAMSDAAAVWERMVGGRERWHGGGAGVWRQEAG